MEDTNTRSLTSANLLTGLRLLLVPVFILLTLYGRFDQALVVFLLAGVTDLFDGLIARHFDQRSQLGMLLDPIADKLLLMSSFVVLSLPGAQLTTKIPLWLTVTVISRDVLLISGVMIVNLALGRHVFPPSQWGKWTTTSQLFTVFAVLVDNVFEIGTPLIIWVFYLTLALTIISGLHYFARGWRLFAYKKARPDSGKGQQKT